MAEQTKGSGENTLELSILMPCLNEAETLEICIEKAQKSLRQMDIVGEVIIADNCSTDGSQDIASRMGARVVPVAAKGYGTALMGGILAARGVYIIMGDADDSYDFSNLGAFVEKLRGGCDLVMGNRFQGGIKPGAMPPLHKYLGNPVLTWVGRLFFASPAGDFHCGLRGFRRDSILKLDLQTTGMEFASEMVVKASLYKLNIAEVPTVLSPDGRSRPPHLRTWRDGWRHLRFLLLYSPRWLFLYPGVALMIWGLIIVVWLLPGSRKVGSINFDVHTLLYGAIAIIIGFQAVTFAFLTKVFAISEKLLPADPKVNKIFRYFTLETGLIVGFILILIGIFGSIFSLTIWSETAFGTLDPSKTLRLVIPSLTCLTVGLQMILSSFFLSVLRLKRK
ncbi:glycosyltransferase family 2 protein [Microcoleus sp. LEGE 07076]|uniref:glycosyltransferase family 2 protein n=1 Tax=Microcoleus sp. LEGE 07076 TaxID=915322 RepID=UPI00187FFF4F|nr:glycosyltransferase family 2 protein [Microcoleus sp. LEGE 07076]MBE9184507.1 glycosyltransferase family 2 protein [Microcoleus sp. LEGE 07076]